MTQQSHAAPTGPSGEEDPAEFWENMYAQRRDDARIWGSRVNPRLVEVVESLGPGEASRSGDALDLGCGAGGDALWLARKGWRVTAVDIATTAVEKLRSLAHAEGLDDRVTAEQHDLARTFPGGTYDLVSAQYFHTPFELPRAQVLRRAARALRTDGRLLIVDHGSIAPWSWNQDPNAHFPTASDLAAELDLDPDEWLVRRADSPQREAVGPSGETATVTDTVLLIQRAGR